MNESEEHYGRPFDFIHDGLIDLFYDIPLWGWMLVAFILGGVIL